LLGSEVENAGFDASDAVVGMNSSVPVSAVTFDELDAPLVWVIPNPAESAPRLRVGSRFE